MGVVDEVTRMRLRTGHTKLTHAYLGEEEKPKYQLCNEDLTVHQIFETCSVYEESINVIKLRRKLPIAIGNLEDQLSKTLIFVRTQSLKPEL